VQGKETDDQYIVYHTLTARDYFHPALAREIAKISNAKKWSKLAARRGEPLNSARKLRNDAQCKTASEFLIEISEADAE